MSDLVRKIIHVDMDAFYASVEQRDDLRLRGKPVAVGHGARRGVVAAASYEARAFGVRSALPSVTALRQCPDLIFVPPRFEVYRAVSAQIHAIFGEFTDLIEPLALDEAYLDVTGNKAGPETAWLTAKAIRARILEETGLTASAGVSYNKFLAKLASGRRKPNGQFAIQPHEGEAFVAALPVAKFHGVGPATAAKMHALGIQTGADLKRLTRAQVVGLRDHLRRGLDGCVRDRGRGAGDGRRRLGLVREDRPTGADGYGEDQVGRLPAVDSQPVAGRRGRKPRAAARGEPAADPVGVSAGQGNSAGGRHPVEFLGPTG